MGAAVDELRLRRLLDAGRALVAELDQRDVLERVLETAREITGARYAALGVLDERRVELEQFITVGVDPETHRAIGDLPRGRGVLGVLIDEPRPLRLSDVGDHPRSYGFPAGHPVMRSFLGVPVVIRGEAWGNLYLTEKEGGEFTAADEEAAVILAEWAATAIENARLYQTSERRRRELERAVRGLESWRDVAVAIGGETEVARVLELIAKRGRALIDARSVLIMLREGEELVVAASAGHVRGVRGVRVPIAESTAGEVLQRRRPQRISDATARLRIAPSQLGVPDAHTALLMPMIHRGQSLGVLAAFDHGEHAEAFAEDDEQLLRAFAASATNAVAMAHSVQSDRLRASIAAADSERRRWARELHDETLQGLGALRVLLASALRRGDPARKEEAMREAVAQISQEIDNLRGIITDLRPAALDELGLGPALEALIERRGRGELEIVGEIDLPEARAADGRLDPEIETTAYRLVQEALTNVAKHAEARRVRVSVRARGDELTVEVQDDGRGFDAAARTSGFGLAGMRERVYLVGGTLEIESGEEGTLLQSRFGLTPSRGGRSGAAA